MNDRFLTASLAHQAAGFALKPALCRYNPHHRPSSRSLRNCTSSRRTQAAPCEFTRSCARTCGSGRKLTEHRKLPIERGRRLTRCTFAVLRYDITATLEACCLS
eukprot:scaffold353713_cov22-Prasinocladus_malaysianus.AAC.1